MLLPDWTREAFLQRLGNEPTSPFFVLVDGSSDPHGISFHHRLEHALSEIQDLGVKIMVTSRHNCGLDDIQDCFFADFSCDFCPDPEQGQELQVYWQCGEGHVVCGDCYSRMGEKGCTLADHEW